MFLLGDRGEVSPALFFLGVAGAAGVAAWIVSRRAVPKSYEKLKPPEKFGPVSAEGCAAFMQVLLDQGSLLREYTHFNVYLDQKQYYLGRCFVWGKRPGCTDFFALTEKEWAELRLVTADMARAYAASFQPDLVNVAFLGNSEYHLHAHLVPRYQTPPEFLDMDWTDEAFGHNYSQDCARGPRCGGRKIKFVGKDTWIFTRIRTVLISALDRVGAGGTSPSGSAKGGSTGSADL